MARLHLTDRALRGLSTEKVQEDIYDTVLPGFGVRVSRAGSRTFFLRYRAGGRARRLQLGSYPEVSLAQARNAARIARGELARNVDPAADRDRRRQGLTFRELADYYLERYAKARKASWREDERIIARDLLPAWGERKAWEVSKADVLEVLDRIVDRGAPVQANRTLAIARRVFNWAMERDIVQHNPCTGVRKPAEERARERVLSEGEIRAVWQALEPEALPLAVAFQLLLLTGQRANEVLSMRWEDIHDNLWTIPAEVTKGKRAHPVPLSLQAKQAVARIERSRDDEWVLLSPRKPGARLYGTSLSHVATRLRRRVGFDWRTHDLRRSVASHMARLGVSRFIIARVLNHADSSVTAIYDRHSYIPEMREALERWGRHLEEIVS